MVKQYSLRFQAYLRLALVLGALILINVLASFQNWRLDLTAEQRYSLHPNTRALMAGLKDVVFVRVYLEGDFPPGFRKLRNTTEDLLRQMRRESGGKLEFEFTDPSAQADRQSTNELFEQLYKQGLQPTDLQVRGEDNSMSRQVIWPGAMVYYRGQEKSANFLLGGSPGATPMQILNASEENLEFALVDAIDKIVRMKKPKIAFTEGHGELEPAMVSDIAKTLSEHYSATRYDLNRVEAVPEDVDMLVIAKPSAYFSDWTRYKLDHFVMRGGRILWCLEGVGASMDSMGQENAFMAMPVESGLEDLLFRYGIRVNANLIQDFRAAPIPVVYGSMGGQPQTKLFPWYYFPLVLGDGQHPLSRNLDPILLRFVSSIDTVTAPGIRKEVLLASSDRSRSLASPLRVHLGTATEALEESQFQNKRTPVAVLLEGTFHSAYRKRVLNEFAQKAVDSLQMPKKDSINNGRMIVVADGDLLRNEVRVSTGEIYPLGLDRFTGQQYGNRNFALNAVAYLLEDRSTIELRARRISLRLLNAKRVKEEKLFWQVMNLGLPLLLLLAYGGLRYYRRKRAYVKPLVDS
ncbi:MAG: gliding motility-associated ABC transporter substrate-binding protein GldG [Bacteroidota bacterium]